MKMLLFLALAVFAGGVAADSSAVSGSAATPVVRGHLEFRIVIPAILYLDRATGTWRTNVRRAGSISVAEIAGAPDRAATGVRKSVGLTPNASTSAVNGGGEHGVAHSVAFP
jgi:hypothetical protein